jgi:hypothetical protein
MEEMRTRKRWSSLWAGGKCVIPYTFNTYSNEEFIASKKNISTIL